MHSAEKVVPITRNYLYYYTSKIFVFHQKEIENHRIFNRRDIKKTYFSRGVPPPHRWLGALIGPLGGN